MLSHDVQRCAAHPRLTVAGWSKGCELWSTENLAPQVHVCSRVFCKTNSTQRQPEWLVSTILRCSIHHWGSIPSIHTPIEPRYYTAFFHLSSLVCKNPASQADGCIENLIFRIPAPGVGPLAQQRQPERLFVYFCKIRCQTLKFN